MLVPVLECVCYPGLSPKSWGRTSQRGCFVRGKEGAWSGQNGTGASRLDRVRQDGEAQATNESRAFRRPVIFTHTASTVNCDDIEVSADARSLVLPWYFDTPSALEING